nr:hypothetical protein [Tanacetum cinerariifolium]
MLNNKCRMSFVKPEYLKKAKQANPRLYDIGCYNDNLALMLSPESDEVIRLEKESRSKLSDLIRPFDYAKLNSLYDLFVPQREKSFEQRFFKKIKIQTMNMLNNKCQTSFVKPEYLKKAKQANPRLYDIGCYNDNFALMLSPESNEVIRLEKESRSKLSDLIRPFDYAKLNSLYDLFVPQHEKSCLKEEMVVDLRYFNSLESEVDSIRSQLETQKTQFSNEIDRLSREYYYADHMNAILGVYTELDEVTNLHCDYLELLQKCECPETELSKSKIMSKSFESVQKHAINLELELQQCKEKVKNDMSFKVNKSKDFCKEREQYFEIQDLKAQLQDKGIVISELKKLIEKLKGKSVDTKFEKSSVIRQPNAFKS